LATIFFIGASVIIGFETLTGQTKYSKKILSFLKKIQNNGNS